MSAKSTASRQVAEAALAVHAAAAINGTPAELEGVDHADGTPCIEYTHTSTDAETLETTVQHITAQLTVRIGRMTPTPKRVDVVGYSPVDSDDVAIQYHVRRRWAQQAVDADGWPDEKVIEEIATNAEDFIAVEGVTV